MTSDSEDTSSLASARRVLLAESEALAKLATGLDATFGKAVEILAVCKGRVIVSGMGKSGHIARKIAATMASTGTPAIFVHPGEASHGDLGMVTREDCVVALSNSGDTAELGDLIAYSRRFSIPLVGITSRAQSALAQAADVSLLLPPLPEAGSLGLAPTTSTTMMLALGDALAVALLEAKGFTASDFRNFHPGGKLGNKLARVEDMMHKGEAIPLAKENDAMNGVIMVMTEKRLGCAGIVDDAGKLRGIITDGDLRRHMDAGILTKKAREVMTSDPMTVTSRMLAAEAMGMLNDNKRTQVFVVENGVPVGVLHIHDLLQAGIA